MTDLRVDWDDLRGSPRRIAGALHARRGVSADVAGRDWIDANWSSLAAALGADAEDALEEVQAGDMPDDVMTVTYRRLRAGVPMPENLVKVYVTTERHRLGAGVVLRLEAQWDTDVATASVPADDLGEDQAILLAEDALGVVLRPDDVDVDLRWRCFRGEGPACGPTWRVQWLRNEESVDLDDPTRGLEADMCTSTRAVAMSSAPGGKPPTTRATSRRARTTRATRPMSNATCATGKCASLRSSDGPTATPTRTATTIGALRSGT